MATYQFTMAVRVTADCASDALDQATKLIHDFEDEKGFLTFMQDGPVRVKGAAEAMDEIRRTHGRVG